MSLRFNSECLLTAKSKGSLFMAPATRERRKNYSRPGSYTEENGRAQGGIQ